MRHHPTLRPRLAGRRVEGQQVGAVRQLAGVDEQTLCSSGQRACVQLTDWLSEAVAQRHGAFDRLWKVDLEAGEL